MKSESSGRSPHEPHRCSEGGAQGRAERRARIAIHQRQIAPVLPRQIPRAGLGERDDRPFRRAVGRDVVEALAAGDGGGVDDLAATTLRDSETRMLKVRQAAVLSMTS